MTTDDKTLLEAAARAAGIYVEIVENSYSEIESPWNPLIDGNDCLELIAKLRIDVEWYGGYVHANALDGERSSEPIGPDPAASLRRAVVRAAASAGGSNDGS